MPSRERVDSVDILKGLAIVLVVLYHSAHLALPLEFAAPWWREVDAALSTFRMPAFFFASGLFASSVIRRPWGQFWSTRIALLVWIFVIWTLIRYLYFLAVPLKTRPFETDVTALLLAPVWPPGGLWFLHALALFFVLAKLFAWVPAWAQITFAAVLSAASYGPLNVGNLSYDGMAHYFVFFVLALHLRELVVKLNRERHIVLTITALTLFVAGIYFASTTRLAKILGAHTGVGFLAVLTGVFLARVLQDSPLRSTLAYLGKNTLPIYVQHVILICAVYSILLAGDLSELPAALAAVLPLIVAVTVTAVALAVHTAATRLRWGRLLFTAPAWMTGRGNATVNNVPSRQAD